MMASGSSEPDPQPAESRSLDASVLDEIIRKMMADVPLDELKEEELRALCDVANRFREVPLQLDPVVVALVGTILKLRLKHLVASGDDLQQMAREIGTSLVESPTSEQRLQLLWTKLVEAAS